MHPVGDDQQSAQQLFACVTLFQGQTDMVGLLMHLLHCCRTDKLYIAKFFNLGHKCLAEFTGNDNNLSKAPEGLKTPFQRKLNTDKLKGYLAKNALSEDPVT